MLGPRMISLTGIRFLIEFSSILVLAFLCIMHEFSDVTWAKQFNIDHASNLLGMEDLEQTSFQLTSEEKSFVKFTPESLDFGNNPISMPVVETVYIHNNHDEINIQMISISGNTEHFHCSFFEDKIVPPRSNTSFQIVFLARQEGLVNNTLYIHSSIGSFQYHVSAYGEVSPFRIRPLIGARVPLNSSFASHIYIYNPFSTPLQLTEMYTSGGGLHLELPDDSYEAHSNLWKVPPYETRTVMKAHFIARIASNHSSYIRIRTNASDIQFMVPVEVEVSNTPGLYSPIDTLDFGVLRAKHDKPKVLPIQVINAAMKSIFVQNVIVTPISEGLTVDFKGPMKLSPRFSTPYIIANLTLDPSQFSCSGLCLGKVVIKSKNNQYKLSIPFVVRIIQGELYFDNTLSHFYIKGNSNYSQERILTVENRFDSPIIVHDIFIPDEAVHQNFKLTIEHQLPIVLPIGVSFPLLKVEFTPSPKISYMSTVIRLQTNFSNFDLPLFAYRGQLDLFIPNSSDQSKLNIGLVGLNEHKSATFVVSNYNPFAIRLLYWNCNLKGVTVELAGTSQGDVKTVNQQTEPSGLSRKQITMLEFNHFAVFRVHVNKFAKEGNYTGLITITIPDTTLEVPIMFKVLKGSLFSEPVLLPKTFPGKIVKSIMNIRSNYTSNIRIKGVFVEPRDDRFKIKLIDQILKPDQDNQIQITFDASNSCIQNLCYSSLDTEKEGGNLWLLASGLYSYTAHIDKELYQLLRNQWIVMNDLDRSPRVNIHLQIDGFSSFITHAQAQLHWPRLTNKLAILFPSIRIGKKITKELVIENTSDQPVLVQAINVIDYPNSEVLIQLMSNNMFHQQWSLNDLQAIQTAIRTDPNYSPFSLTNNSESSGAGVKRNIEWFGIENENIMLFHPGVRHRLSVSFSPLYEKNFTSLLILRNNLTIIDVVLLHGEGGRGLLKIGKALPNTANSKLIFEASERSLEKKCRQVMSKDSAKVHYNSLVIKMKFKAVNIGRMGLQIRNFLIDGMPCEGYGFRINRCEPIYLAPNQSFDIEIAYSPDFTQPTVNHELNVVVDDDTVNLQKFQLVANVPQKLLRTCLNSLPRPMWETFIYYLLVFMAFFVLLLSIIVAIFDARRINFYYSNYKGNGKKDKHENDCDDTKYETVNAENGKKQPNSNSTNQISNGKQQQNHQNGQTVSKVRNRKGNKNSSNNKANASKNNNSTQSFHNKTDDNNKNKNVANQIKNEANLDCNDPSNWSYVMRKKLLRQDSSSSEPSQRSSDNNNSSSNLMKSLEKENKENNRKSTEELCSNVQNQQTAANQQSESRKQKSKEDKKVIENSKNVKKSKNTKSQKSITVDKTNKTSEKTSSTDATMSSTESLTFPSISKAKVEMPIKARSATLPLTNDSQISKSSGDISFSQSNLSSNYVLKIQNPYESFQEQIVNKSNKELNKNLKFNSKKPDANYKSATKNVESTSNVNYSMAEFAGSNDLQGTRSKDIWDLPITNFDTELAMSMLVKQTEEFAANDDKPTSTINRNGASRKFTNGMQEKCNTVTRLSEDKWEIGEWSNDLLNYSNMNQNPKNQFKSNKKSSFSNNDLHLNKSRYSYPISKDHVDRSNENHYNRYKKSFGANDQHMAFPSVAYNKSSSPTSNNASFSPIIGRPTASGANKNYASRLGNYKLNPLNEFDLNFQHSLARNSPTSSNFNNSTFEPLKSNLLELDIFEKPNFLPSNLTTYPTNCDSNLHHNYCENKPSLSPLLSQEWNQNSIDCFVSSSSFSTHSTAQSKPSTSSIFNLENESVWTSTNSSWTTHLPDTTNTKSSSLFSSFASPSHSFASDKNEPWPSATTAAAPPPTPSTAFANQNLNTNAINHDFNKLNYESTHRDNWWPFDFNSYNQNANESKPNLSDETTNPIGSLSVGGNSSFDSTKTFELFGGNSPWSPLGGSCAPPSTGIDTSVNCAPMPQLSPSQTPDNRFPQNASPSSTTSSGNLSSASSTSATNQETKTD